MNNFKKYLPSQKFITLILTIIVIAILYFVIKGAISFFVNKNSANNPNEPKKLIIGTAQSIAQKDSNNNGIPDYEEYLWGLDPKITGPENKEFILAKKKTLQEKGVITNIDDSSTISDNDNLSRQFFATIISLQQTGELNQESMDSVSNALGSNITPTPIPDIYNINMLTIVDDSDKAKSEYHDEIANLINQFKDANIGSELTFIIQGINNKDSQALYAAVTVGQAYQQFGDRFIMIPVPRSIIPAHLSAANNYEKVGKSILDLSKVLNDPLLGMKAILNYKNYSDALASDLEKISLILQ